MNKTHEYNNNFKEEYKKAIQFLKKSLKKSLLNEEQNFNLFLRLDKTFM